MKYVLIGCGRISKKHITAAIANGLEIVGFCDKEIEKAIKLKEDFNLTKVNCYKSFYEMMKTEKPDIVAITLPSYLHFIFADLSMEFNCDVIIEKPVCMSLTECELLIEKAKRKNRKIIVCHQNRFNEAAIYTKNAIKNNEIGKILYVSASLRWCRDEKYYALSQWRGKWATEGGMLLNQGIHILDMILWLCDSEVDFAGGYTTNLNHSYIETDDTVFATAVLKNGILVPIEITTSIYGNNLEETILVVGSKGSIEIGGCAMNKITFNSLGDKFNIVNTGNDDIYGNGHIKLYKNFINAINGDEDIAVTANDGKNAVEFAKMIYKNKL